jgi:hypothetical protein
MRLRSTGRGVTQILMSQLVPSLAQGCGWDLLSMTGAYRSTRIHTSMNQPSPILAIRYNEQRFTICESGRLLNQCYRRVSHMRCTKHRSKRSHS